MSFQQPPRCGSVLVLYPYPESLEEGLLNNLQHLNPIPEHEEITYRPIKDPITGEIRPMYPKDIDNIKRSFGYEKDSFGKWIRVK